MDKLCNKMHDNDNTNQLLFLLAFMYSTQKGLPPHTLIADTISTVIIELYCKNI